MLTDAILMKAFPALSATTRTMILTASAAAFARYDINTPRRIAAFLGQTAHESGMFKRKIENLNYSAQGLIKTWPTRFNPANVEYYARNPVRIANRVYSGRLGNGPEATGEAARYIGRGFIQLTGKANYQAFAGAMGMTLDAVVAYLETDEGASMSAAWFWSRSNLNALTDGWQITTLGARINGMNPPHGNKERLALSNACLKALA